MKMKRLLPILTLLFISHMAFSQKSEIETKLSGLKLKAIQKGKLVDYELLNRAKGKVVILEFWETWCAPCIEGMPHLKKLKEQYADNLEIICVSSDGFQKNTNFINTNAYPFEFIFDEKKALSNIFPHSGIPFSVLIDKKGKIQAGTYPAYIDERVMNQILSGKIIDVPDVKNFNPDDLKNNKNTSPLISFELFSHELGERSYSNLITEERKKRIITNYFKADSFIDTTETVSEYVSSGKNILDLYKFAYGNIAQSRFIFADNLNYINSFAPNNRYKLNFKVSNLFGDFNTVLVRQLNAALGLETEKVSIDTTFLMLKKVEINGNSIKLTDPNIQKSFTTNISNQFFEVIGNDVSLETLVELISNKTGKIVDFDNSVNFSYQMNVKMDHPIADIDEWLKYFEKEGFYLTKEKKKVEFIKIKKVY